MPYPSVQECNSCYSNPEVFENKAKCSYHEGTMDLMYAIFGTSYLCKKCFIAALDGIVGSDRERWYREGKREALENAFDMGRAAAMTREMNKMLKEGKGR